MDMATVKEIAENVVLLGSAAAAIWYGVKSIYKTARNVEKLVETSELAEVDRKVIHEKITKLHNDLKDHANDLKEHIGLLGNHISKEELYNQQRDDHINQMTDHINAILAETQCNGGSSMKDVLNTTNKNVAQINRRVALLEKLEPTKLSLKPLKQLRKKKVARRTKKSK